MWFSALKHIIYSSNIIQEKTHKRQGYAHDVDK